MLEFVKQNRFPIVVVILFIALYLYTTIKPCDLPGRFFYYCTYLQASPEGGSTAQFPIYPYVVNMIFGFIILPLVIIGIYLVMRKNKKYK